MKNSKRKHFLLIFLIILIAIFSVQDMMTRANVEKINIVAVVLPKDKEADYSRVMDGIRDYAINNDILLDVWYKDSISLKELETLIADEEKNHAIGVLLVYPEKYMNGNTDEKYDFDNVLAITDTMKEYFSYTATFEETNEVTCSIPVSAEVIEQLTEDNGQFIYIQNTYKLGYCSMEKMEQYGKGGSMDDICLEYMKVDGTTIANGDIDSLLAE
ncbi:MAG: hypothetical protein PUC17_10395 [Anaerostipes sp.]|nr:hypothetical protein [Anaerostipes sp.]